MELGSKRELVDFFTAFVFRRYPEQVDSNTAHDRSKVDWAKKIMKRKDIQEVLWQAVNRVGSYTDRTHSR